MQAWSKWAQSVAAGRAIQSCIGPNSTGYIFAHAYNSGYSSDTGLPMHLTGCYFAHSGYPTLFGTSYGNWYEKSIITSGNIGSQSVSYASSAGSVAWGNITGKPSTYAPSSHTHSYLPLSGGTLTGNLHLDNSIVRFISSTAAFSGERFIGPHSSHSYDLTYYDGSTWQKVWHSGNDGSGSGLDADLLDGHDSSYFATSGHNHDGTYLKLSGGSLTGNLTATNSYLKAGGNGLQYPIRITRSYNDSVEFLIGSAAESGTNGGLDMRISNNSSGGGGEVYIDLIHGGGGVNIYPSLTVNGYGVITSNNIGSQSVSYASSAGSAGSTTYIGPQSYTPTSDTVAGHKEGLVNWMNTNGATGIGNHVIVSASIINQWGDDTASAYPSSVYAFIKLGGGYNYSTYGQWLLSGYSTNRLGVIGRNGNTWDSGGIRWIAYTSDIPTNTNQLTNGAGYITSSGSCSYSTSSGDSSKLSGLSLDRFVYSVGSGSFGTSERTGNSEDFERTMFWRDNNKGAIGVFVSHSGAATYGWEIHAGYSRTSDFVGRVKENGTWGNERTFITSTNISSYAATTVLTNSEIDTIIV